MKSENRALTVLLIIITIILTGAFFQKAAKVLVPLVVSIYLAFLLGPLVTISHKLKIPQWLSIMLIVLIILTVGYLVGIIIISSFQAFINELPKYSEKFAAIYDQLAAYINGKLGYEIDFLSGVDWLATVRSYVGVISSGLVTLTSSIFLVMLYLIFILLERNFFPIKINKAFSGKALRRVTIIMEHINRDIGKYIRIKTFISLGTGFLIWIVLSILGVDFAFVWGVLAVMFNFIPNIGSILIVVLIILMSLVQFFPSIGIVVLTGILCTVIQLVMGNFLDPRLQGAKLNLSPLLILVSLLIWGWIWGIVGMFLAVPLTVTIKIICANISSLKPVSIMMGVGGGKLKKSSKGLFVRKRKPS